MTEVRSAWTAVLVIILGLAVAAGGAYLVYKYRFRVSLKHNRFAMVFGHTYHWTLNMFWMMRETHSH